ncbi:MAG: hypothetical protein LBL87_00840 [Ruminococcus sp.]|jgi:hypothetical protein|nr:hypothetical protein [Ruminococcus sp.]
MKTKTVYIFKRAIAAFLPLLLIFALTGATSQTGLEFEVKRTVIADNLDFSYRFKIFANDTNTSSYYKDTDGSFVLLVTEYANSSLKKDDPNYDEKMSLSLIRVYPGKNIHNKTVKLHEWAGFSTETFISEYYDAPFIWKNKRGNTVIVYSRSYSNPIEPTEHENGEEDIVFEEYNKNFKLIKKTVYSAYDLPGGVFKNTLVSSEKDDSDNYYLSTNTQVLVFDADFKLLGAVDDIPENPSLSSRGEENRIYAHLMVSKGSDGAIYAYWFDKQTRQIYKINPKTLTSKHMFDIDIEKSAWLYPGEGDTLFYGYSKKLYAIDKTGKAKEVFEEVINGVEPYFGDTEFVKFNVRHYVSYAVGLYEKDGNYYNLIFEDKDGDSETKNDKQLVLYEFIRK